MSLWIRLPFMNILTPKHGESDPFSTLFLSLESVLVWTVTWVSYFHDCPVYSILHSAENMVLINSKTKVGCWKSCLTLAVLIHFGFALPSRGRQLLSHSRAVLHCWPYAPCPCTLPSTLPQNACVPLHVLPPLTWNSSQSLFSSASLLLYQRSLLCNPTSPPGSPVLYSTLPSICLFVCLKENWQLTILWLSHFLKAVIYFFSWNILRY